MSLMVPKPTALPFSSLAPAAWIPASRGQEGPHSLVKQSDSGAKVSPTHTEGRASGTAREGRRGPPGPRPDLPTEGRGGSIRKDHFKFSPQVTEQVNTVTPATWASRFLVRC